MVQGADQNRNVPPAVCRGHFSDVDEAAESVMIRKQIGKAEIPVGQHDVLRRLICFQPCNDKMLPIPLY